MWRLWPLLWATLGRRRLRLIFTLASIAIAFLLFGLLGAVKNAFTAGIEVAGQDRMMVMHRVSIIQSLPRSYMGRVAGMPELRAVASLSWFGGYYQDERNQLPMFAVDNNYFDLYPEILLKPKELAAWQDDRGSVVVGRAVATRYGWKIGDIVPFSSNIYRKADGSNAWPARVAAIYDVTVGDTTNVMLHYDYWNESRANGKDSIGWIILQLRNPSQAGVVARTVDAMFANSRDETKTSSERAVAQSFANQIGNIGAMLTFVVTAVFFAMLLVTANTMAQSVRERTPELAVLKTLGFSDVSVLTFVLAESVLITLSGGLIGLVLALGVIAVLGPIARQFLPVFELPLASLVGGFIFMIVLGLAAGAVPAITAQRLRITEALRRG